MDPQTTRAQVEGDQGEPHEKKSVMNRVKARAMKIKDNLVTKTHGHGQANDQHENDDDHELDEEVEHDYEKLDQDPEVHDAPIHESVPARNVTNEHDEHPKQSEVNKSPLGEDFGAPKQRHQEPANYQTSVPSLGAVHESESAAARNITTGQGHDMQPKQTEVNLGGKSPFEELTEPKRHEEPANNETRVPNLGADGKEAGITPISHSFGKMDIHDKPRHTNEPPETGSHDQLSPTPSPDFSSDKTNTTAENTIPVPKGYVASESDENRPENMNVDQPNQNVDQPNQGGYTDKMPSVNSAKNVVASEIGYGDKTDDKTAGAQTDTGGNVPSAGVPIVTTESVEEPTTQQSSYTEKVSSATYAIADKFGYGDKAVSAKNMVASKLGYGGSPDSASSTGAELNKGGENAKTGGGVTKYGRQIASTVTEKLAPVYGKVAGAGSAVVSKIPGAGMGTQKNTDEGVGVDTNMGTGSQVDTGRGVGETDKGVASGKGYIAEKLKPGEEDKALSEVISGAFRKPKVAVDNDEKKEVGQGQGQGQVVSDASHKRNNEEEMDRENKPIGKVTESEKVADQLGSSESEREGHVSGNDNSPGKGVVGKFKGAFTSWFGKGGETNPSQAFNDINTSQGAKGDQGISGAEQNGGEKRLQEGAMGEQGIPGAEQNGGEKRLQESTN